MPGNRAVTNIRNTASSYWRAWMKPENRCLVPATSFCEYAPGKPAVPHWFALGEDRPLFVFAGLWRPWTGVRGTKADPAHGAHELFAFLTCEPNAVVAPVHPKAMPVILTTPEECEAWLELAHHVRRRWPWIALLVASGNFRPSPDAMPVGSRFLPKPYHPDHVVKHVRELVEAG